MEVPSINKVNTLGITYTQGGIRDYHFETIFEKIMGIPEEEIDGIDDRDTNRFIFQVTTHERYLDICTNFTTRDIFLEYGNVIRVDDISSGGTRVEISRVPFDVSNEMLTKILQNYGDVINCQTYFRKYGKYTNCKKSGIRIAYMNIKTPIPHTINIKQLQNFINVKYEEQPFTCNICGRVGHRARSCKVKPNDFINTIKTNLLDDDEIDNIDFDSDVVDLDIHIDPSQNNNKFECPTCDYTCTYANVLIDHMESHTEEEPLAYDETGHQTNNATSLLINKKDGKHIKCHICEFVSATANTHKEHMVLHDNEILLSCTECDYNCRNKDVLNIHFASHNIYICKDCNFQCKSETQLSEHNKSHTVTPSKPIHTGGKYSSDQTNANSSTNKSKRGLSASPEVTDSKKTTLRSNNGTKKPKT